MREKTMVIIAHYPKTFSFVTDELTNEFNEELGCSLRDRLLHEELKKQNIDSPHHAYTEYTVEEVETTFFGGMKTELWGLGS